MNGSQYAVSLSVFFVTYCLFEIPSNLCLQRFRPSYWICFITFAWLLLIASSSLLRPSVVGPEQG